MSAWTKLFGDVLRTKAGVKATTEVLNNKKLVGIYFSASWCPPCRQFTPIFNSVYKELKAAHPDMEVVFVPSDRTAESYEEYYKEMDFCSVPFEEEVLRAKLGAAFNVRTIPHLAFLDEDAERITSQGRDLVAMLREDSEAIWDKLMAEK